MFVNIWKILQICSFLCSYQIASINCDVSAELPILGIEMDDEGFHRELTYNVQFDYPFAGRECEYLLEQRFPAAVYISVDQLDGLKRLSMLDAIYPKFIDIEASTSRAFPFSILLRGVPKITDTIVVPIHFRYHAADNKSTAAIVDIEPPVMYMHCLVENNDWLEDELEALQMTANTKYCLNVDSCSLIVTSRKSDTTHLAVNEQTDCNWRMIKVQHQLKSSLRATIPIGNKDMLPLVFYTTIALSWLAVIVIIWSTYRIPWRINSMLGEQHALANKIK